MVHLYYLKLQKFHKYQDHDYLEDCKQADEEPEKHVIVVIELSEIVFCYYKRTSPEIF